MWRKRRKYQLAFLLFAIVHSGMRRMPPVCLHHYQIHQRACTKSQQTDQRTTVQTIIPATPKPTTTSHHEITSLISQIAAPADTWIYPFFHPRPTPAYSDQQLKTDKPPAPGTIHPFNIPLPNFIKLKYVQWVYTPGGKYRPSHDALNKKTGAINMLYILFPDILFYGGAHPWSWPSWWAQGLRSSRWARW